MRLKYQVFKTLEPVAKAYVFFKWLSWLQTLITVALPFVWPDIDTSYWLLSLALLGLWLSTYVVLKMAFAHEPPQKGVRGWFNRVAENTIFIVWAVVFIFAIALVFKVVMLF